MGEGSNPTRLIFFMKEIFLNIIIALCNIHELENFVKHVLFPKHELANIKLLSL